MKVVNDKTRALGAMMKPISKIFAALTLLIMTLSSSAAMAAIIANLDRDRVALGDTVRLTIIATDDEKLTDIDLTDLSVDFEIAGRSTNNSTSIVNGRLSQTRKVIIDLAPKRLGNLYVPSIRIGQNTTQGIPVKVTPASKMPTGQQTVIFDVEIDKNSVYVQGQVILTLRIQQSIPLDGANISELQLDNAFVKRLEQNSFQRDIDGRPWRVNEVRYAIFPEQSGTLEIPAQVFSARISRGRQSFFDLGGGQLLRRTSEPLSINVRPKPSSFPTNTWLPTPRLTLKETWSTEPNELRVGESTTRTVTIVGNGLQGAQLPPILFTPIDGLKYYPDQPTIEDQEATDGLVGIRQDSAAVVPVRSGTYVIPEIRIPWWNTLTEMLEYAVLPERTITVTATEMNDFTTESAPVSAPVNIADSSPSTSLPSWLERSIWKLISGVSLLGWLLTLVYLWRMRRPATPSKSKVPEVSVERDIFKQLLASCADNNATQTRSAIIDWAGAFMPRTSAVSLDDVAKLFADEEFTREVNTLDNYLYNSNQESWDGAYLAECLRRLRRESRLEDSATTRNLTLYPNGD